MYNVNFDPTGSFDDYFFQLIRALSNSHLGCKMIVDGKTYPITSFKSMLPLFTFSVKRIWVEDEPVSRYRENMMAKFRPINVNQEFPQVTTCIEILTKGFGRVTFETELKRTSDLMKVASLVHKSIPLDKMRFAPKEEVLYVSDGKKIIRLTRQEVELYHPGELHIHDGFQVWNKDDEALFLEWRLSGYDKSLKKLATKSNYLLEEVREEKVVRDSDLLLCIVCNMFFFLVFLYLK